jgi:DNA-binding PadR family transcriptional regulator
VKAAVFGHGQLRLYLLGLLAERPMHGYELIQELSQRFGGTYAPSAGTVYPRLTRMQEEGLIVAQTDGRRTVHEITDAGRTLVAERQDDLTALQAEVNESVRRLAGDARASVNEAMRALRADLAASTASPTDTWQRPRTEGPRADARRAAEEADALLTGFRHEVRAELRAAAAREALPDTVIPLLRAQLAETRAAIEKLLRP